MAKILQQNVSSLQGLINNFKQHLMNKPLVTDFISKMLITFGVVLIIGGFYLMVSDSGPTPQAGSIAYSVVSSINWVPGIPFYITGLYGSSVSVIGLAGWLVGLDLLLVGLGLWIRHRLARFIAIAVFVLSAVFQFIQFVYSGIIGSPGSVFGFCVDAFIVYFLLTRFDTPIVLPKNASVEKV